VASDIRSASTATVSVPHGFDPFPKSPTPPPTFLQSQRSPSVCQTYFYRHTLADVLHAARSRDRSIWARTSRNHPVNSPGSARSEVVTAKREVGPTRRFSFTEMLPLASYCRCAHVNGNSRERHQFPTSVRILPSQPLPMFPRTWPRHAGTPHEVWSSACTPALNAGGYCAESRNWASAAILFGRLVASLESRRSDDGSASDDSFACPGDLSCSCAGGVARSRASPIQSAFMSPPVLAAGRAAYLQPGQAPPLFSE
jgi:hypothetical protein